jgi:putative flippase GtrA
MNNRFFVQAFKYGIVGVLNTLLTAAVIWFMMHFLFHLRGEESASSTAVSVSNIVGYIVGLLNSFVWNRKWTFQSTQDWKPDFLRFIAAFLVCYIPQLLLVMLLNKHSGIMPYFCQLTGIVFYTVCNFLFNKYYTFREIEK